MSHAELWPDAKRRLVAWIFACAKPDCPGRHRLQLDGYALDHGQLVWVCPECELAQQMAIPLPHSQVVARQYELIEEVRS